MESFSNLLPLLPQNFYYVCIDLPGHGRSAHANVGYILDMPWYVLAVKRVIDHFKWSNIYLLGHSLGGNISFFISALYPELVLKLIIIDTLTAQVIPSVSFASILRNSYLEPTLKLEKLSPDEAPIYSLEDFVEKMKEARLTDVTTEQLAKMAERNLSKVGHNQYKFTNDQRTKMLGLQSHFTVEFLENVANDICCPTLLILARNSIVTRPESEDRRIVLKVNKNATIHITDGDHDMHISRPNQVAQFIVPFLRKETKSKL